METDQELNVYGLTKSDVYTACSNALHFLNEKIKNYDVFKPESIEDCCGEDPAIYTLRQIAISANNSLNKKYMDRVDNSIGYLKATARSEKGLTEKEQESLDYNRKVRTALLQQKDLIAKGKSLSVLPFPTDSDEGRIYNTNHRDFMKYTTAATFLFKIVDSLSAEISESGKAKDAQPDFSEVYGLNPDQQTNLIGRMYGLVFDFIRQYEGSQIKTKDGDKK
ncbi:hypothetical protein ACFL0W_02610 [Nanoarchaeota archaeon]